MDQDKPAFDPSAPPAGPSGPSGPARPAGAASWPTPFGASGTATPDACAKSAPPSAEADPAGLPAVDAIPGPLLSLRILALLCLGLPVLIYAVVGASRYQQIRTETEVRLDRSLRIAGEHALRVLDTSETVLARAGDALDGDGDMAITRRERFFHEQLRTMSQRKPQIQSIRVLGPDGRTLASDRDYPAMSWTSADREYFQWHRSGKGGLYVSELMVDRSTNAPFFNISRGRYQADGTFGGAVAVSLLPGYFDSFHGNLGADEPGLAITMLRDDGAILSRWPPLPNAPDRLSPGSPVMTRIRAGETWGSAHGVSSVDQRERLLTFAKVGDYPIFLGTGMEVAEIRRRWIKEMAWLAAFGLPPLLALFMVAGVALRRTREALEAAQRLGEETRARRRIEESLLQSQKLEALGRLTGGVAHDFNNALMVISNNLFLLKQKHPEVDRARVDSMDRAVDSATKLTRQLLAFSRRQALVPEYVKLQDRMAPFKDLLEPVLGRHIELQVMTAADTAPILVDAAEFELALINLAVNARDAMPAGGRFRISAGNAGPLDLPAKFDGPMVMIEAVDSGTGIEPEILGKVFDPFFTTKPLGGGTGLGLSQIYGLCRRAGGIATIRSRLGVGTAVRLFFPAVAPRDEPAEENPITLPRDLAVTVLLVEDDDEVAAALEPVLQAIGCTVVRLDRAAAAEHWLCNQEILPDVLLTDVVMPGEMDGVALALAARLKFPTLRVILMTGYAEQMDAISRQGFEIIPKPCSAEMLAGVIGRGRTGAR